MGKIDWRAKPPSAPVTGTFSAQSKPSDSTKISPSSGTTSPTNNYNGSGGWFQTYPVPTRK